MVRGVSFDALVVLGCRIHEDQLRNAALRRVERAARAYHEHGSLLVVASGGRAWHGSLEAEVFARGLRERGVPADRLLEERESLTTRGNARGVQRLLRGREVSRLGLVTCDWHMPRALWLFRRRGFDPVAIPAAAPARAAHETSLRWLRERASHALDALLCSTWFRA